MRYRYMLHDEPQAPWRRSRSLALRDAIAAGKAHRPKGRNLEQVELAPEAWIEFSRESALEK